MSARAEAHSDGGPSGSPGERRGFQPAWHGRRIARRAIVESWGAGGHGLRGVVTSAQLHRFLTQVLDEVANAGTSYRDLTVGVPHGVIRAIIGRRCHQDH